MQTIYNLPEFDKPNEGPSPKWPSAFREELQDLCLQKHRPSRLPLIPI